MQNQMIMMLLNQLKAKNPQMFQMVEQARKNKNNPIEFFKQVTNDRTPEQMEEFYKRTEQMGFSPDLINQLRDGINSKE